ncbi:MAG: DUF4430 domain-containing protein [Candidatus Zixiibacteriota bacterium]
MLSLVSCGGEKTGNDDPKNQTETEPVATDSLVIELTGIDSLSVFEILRASHPVEYQSSFQGVFVTAIDSVSGGGGYFWVYEVNDSAATVACDKYLTRNGDRIKWYFRKM